MTKSFLKWLGGKSSLLGHILPHLSNKTTLIEPFCGSGVVSLNSQNSRKIVADFNADLINLFQTLKSEGEPFVDYCSELFIDGNDSEVYYKNRAKFNSISDIREKSALFVYLNRHCFNGLWRYNSKGKLNMAFGSYKTIGFPREEMLNFHTLTQDVDLHCCSFESMFELADSDCVLYLDPPYDPISSTSNFTDYAAGGFGKKQQEKLAELVRSSPAKCIASNHDTPLIRELYKGMEFFDIEVKRRISCKGDSRTTAKEVLIVKE